jgi:hypothetical protein
MNNEKHKNQMKTKVEQQMNGKVETTNKINGKQQ